MSDQERGVRTTTSGGVRTITFARPERRNGMDLGMFRAYYDALAEADASSEVRAVVVTGQGGSFCSGATPDLLDRLAEGTEGRDLVRELGHPPDLPARLGTPVVAAVNGGAAGLGLVHALYADVRFMSSRARLATSFSRFGLAAEYGSAWLLPRLVGTANAADLLLSGRAVDADEALRMGLVQHVRPPEEVLPAARAYAEELAERSSPAAMAVIRRQLWSGLEAPLEEAVAQSVELMTRAFTTPDFQEAVRAVRERRAPRFEPRPR
ncbi:enoyl-CoA hydratase-related protein [Nocardiopsis sp. FIRDI 009]|uniref:enoyl-CoA hydratase-related protein n=1 Tax=Nocardiopsis sp. FIRDI 009 TaxID=714197 RepID=UPI000E2477D3|nr:enoyl-CoA hydratase-related protein [Nocardiopsis sp. FIRDI 009]